MTNKQFKIWKGTMNVFGKVFHCHQLSERSFHIGGFQLPLCARCTGIFFGVLIIGPVCCSLLPINMYVSLGLVFLMFVDGFTQLKGWRESNNILRLITGLGFGYAIVSFVFHIIRMIVLLANY